MSTQQLVQHFTNTTFAVFAMVLGTALSVSNAHAGMEDDFRRQLIKEVSVAIEDKSLVDEIVEIRFRREFEKWKQDTLKQTPVVIQSSNLTTDINSNKDKLQSKSVWDPSNQHSVYGGIGSHLQVGFSTALSSTVRLRTDMRVSLPENKNYVIDSSEYMVDKTGFSLGSYLDWYPYEHGIKISTGLSLNHIKTRALNQPYSSIASNGKFAPSGSNYLDITYSFPKVSPYIGIGFDSSKLNDRGWDAYGEIGVMIGRYDASAKTNLIGVNGITKSDISTQVETIGAAVKNKRNIPVGTIGLRYKF